MTRLGIGEFVRLLPEVFPAVSTRFGPFQYYYELMVTAVSVQRVPAGWPKAGQPLPYFARFTSPGALGVDILTQNIADMQRAYCFPPTGMHGWRLHSAFIRIPRKGSPDTARYYLSCLVSTD